MVNHKQRIKRISTSARKEKLRKDKVKKTKNNHSRVSAYYSKKSKNSKGRKSASQNRGSTSHSAQRKSRVTPTHKVPQTVRSKNKAAQLPPKSKYGKRRSSAVKKTTTPIESNLIPNTVNDSKAAIRPKNMLNEILKESTDNKFLGVIDCLREMRKRNYNISKPGHSGNDSSKSNRNIKTEIEFETSVVELINAYNKCMDQVS